MCELCGRNNKSEKVVDIEITVALDLTSTSCLFMILGGSSLKITKQMICAGKAGTNLSGCHGDSGGPYVCRNSAGRYVLQGAVSWGSPRCSAAERYTVFARVAEFRNWIDQKIGGKFLIFVFLPGLYL